MLKAYLRSSLEGLRVTQVTATGPAGVRVDSELLAAAQILPDERVRVSPHAGGAPFECYAAAAGRGSGIVAVEGAAAAGLQVGDLVSLTTECLLVDREALAHRPRRVDVRGENRLAPGDRPGG